MVAFVTAVYLYLRIMRRIGIIHIKVKYIFVELRYRDDAAFEIGYYTLDRLLASRLAVFSRSRRLLPGSGLIAPPGAGFRLYRCSAARRRRSLSLTVLRFALSRPRQRIGNGVFVFRLLYGLVLGVFRFIPVGGAPVSRRAEGPAPRVPGSQVRRCAEGPGLRPGGAQYPVLLARSDPTPHP